MRCRSVPGRSGAGAVARARVLQRRDEEARAGRLRRRGEVAPHRHAALVGAGHAFARAAEVFGQVPAGEEADRGAGAAGGVGLLAADALEDRVPRVLLGPDDGEPARVVFEVVLDVAVPGVALAQVSLVVVLVGAAGSRAVGVGAADEAQLEGVEPGALLQGEAVLQHVAEHVASAVLVERDGRTAVGAHLSVEHPEGREVVGLVLLEAAELVLGVETAALEAVVAALRGRLVLHQLGDRLEEAALPRLVQALRVGKHQASREVRVVRNRERVAAVVALDALGSKPSPQLRHVPRAGVVGADGQLRHPLVAEDHVAVEVLEVRRVGVLVADEGGEGAGRAAVVVLLRRLLDRPPELSRAALAIHPRQAADARALLAVRLVGHSHVHPLVGGEQLHQEDAAAGHHADRPPVAQGTRVRGADVHLPQELGVVGDRREVDGPPQLRHHHRVAVLVGKLDGLALRVAIGVPGVVALAGDVGVEGVTGVDVKVAEERLTQRIAVLAVLPGLGAVEARSCRDGEQRGRYQGCERRHPAPRTRI
jgi:hypothetical protein